METLEFHAPTLADVPRLHEVLSRWRYSQACDLTTPVIMMWQGYFGTEICFRRDTLFLRGRDEADLSLPAYQLPVGPLPLAEKLDILRGQGSHLRLTAVPEPVLPYITALFPGAIITEEAGWADYIYCITDLATLPGNKYKKKRAHVRRFMADNPGAGLVPITEANAPEVQAFLRALPEDPDMNEMARYERRAVERLLGSLAAFPMIEGMALTTPCHGIAAFALGHAAADTLMVPVEKMRHDIAGAGQAVNYLYAARMKELHPTLLYVNREEDAGDAGLRRAKQSYHPVRLIPKYTVRLP